MFDWDEKPELNITPLVDVMLVLLAILMVISPNIVYEELIKLPKGSAQTEVKEKKEIEIIIPADGSPPSVEALGYEGNDCTKDVKQVLDGLKAKDISKKKTSDYYKKKKIQINQKIQ